MFCVVFGGVGFVGDACLVDYFGVEGAEGGERGDIGCFGVLHCCGTGNSGRRGMVSIGW